MPYSGEGVRNDMEDIHSEMQERKVVILDEAKRVFSLNMDLFKTFRPPSAPLTPSESEQNYPLQTEPAKALTERTYSLSTILSVVIAAGLVHFILVVDGFAGPSGFAKLEVFERWMASLFGSSPAPPLTLLCLRHFLSYLHLPQVKGRCFCFPCYAITG